MRNHLIPLAWAAAVLALLAWIFIVWFAMDLQSMEDQRLSGAKLSANASGQQSKASALHAELQETAAARAQLESLINVDPTTLGTTVAQAGKSAGINLQIQNAAPEASTANSPTQAFDFSVNGAGSFAQVLYALEFLETLPVPSSVQNFQLIHAPAGVSGASSAWQLNAGVRIITAPTISS